MKFHDEVSHRSETVKLLNPSATVWRGVLPVAPIDLGTGWSTVTPVTPHPRRMITRLHYLIWWK